MEVAADGVAQPPSSCAGAAAGASIALPQSPVVQRVRGHTSVTAVSRSIRTLQLHFLP